MPKKVDHPVFVPNFVPRQQAEPKNWEGWMKAAETDPRLVVTAIEEGRRLGIKEAELKKFAETRSKKMLCEELLYQVKLAAHIGSEEELRALAQRIYAHIFFTQDLDWKPAERLELVERLFGKNSRQYKKEIAAKKTKKKIMAEHEQPSFSELAQSATLDDLFAAYHMASEVGDVDSNWTEERIRELLDPASASQLIAFLNAEDDSLKNQRVVSFFKKAGLTKTQVSELFGVKFAAVKKGKS
ncbi:MAG: hypothetical protein Q7R83_00630 [bacterium]|nr:hypothetical protein [bacterium]